MTPFISSERSDRRAVPPLIWLVLLFVATRFLYLVLIHPDRFFMIADDELYAGVIANELVSGLHMPFLEYRSNSYSGGSLVTGGLASCFFRLFGPTVFALKLTPFLLFTLALVFWLLTLHRHADERVGTYFALLFTFSPPLFTGSSLTAIGFHTESIFFTALTVLLFFRLLSDTRWPLWSAVLLGIVSGLGLWFTYIYGITLVTVLLFWFWHDRGMFGRRTFVCFALSFLVGFSPWLVINWQNDFAGLVIQDAKVWEHFGVRYVQAIFSDFRVFFPYQFLATLAFDSPETLQRRLINYAYCALYLSPLMAYAMLVYRTRRHGPGQSAEPRYRLVSFALLYLGLFALAVQFSDFKAPRYNMAAYPFLFVCLAYLLIWLQDAVPHLQTPIRVGFVAGLTTLWVATHAALFSTQAIGHAFTAKGYSYAHFLGFQLCRDDNLRCDEIMLSQLERASYLPSLIQDLSAEDRHELSISLIQLLATQVRFDQGPLDISRLQRLIPPRFEKSFYYHLGKAAAYRQFQTYYYDLGDATSYRRPDDLAISLKKVEPLRSQSVSNYHLALYGVFDEWPESQTSPEIWPTEPSPEWFLAHPVAVSSELLPFYWRSLGHYAARFWYGSARTLENVRTHLTPFVDRVPLPMQHYFLQGVGKFLFYRWDARPVFTLPFQPVELERFPSRFHQGLFEGVGMELSEFQLFSWIAWKGNQDIIWKTTAAGLSPNSIAHVRKGMQEFAALFADPGNRESEATGQTRSAEGAATGSGPRGIRPPLSKHQRCGGCPVPEMS